VVNNGGIVAQVAQLGGFGIRLHLEDNQLVLQQVDLLLPINGVELIDQIPAS
jgi:hypothetical protein